MNRAVQRRPHQVIHRRIHDHERLAAVRLGNQNSSQKTPAGAMMERQAPTASGTPSFRTESARPSGAVGVDSAMNDLMRPALYGAIHPITKVRREKRGQRSSTQARGRRWSVCETGTAFLHDWPLGEVQTGDVLAIWVAGAYGMAQASNYNARCRPRKFW